ncbi:MAG: pseudouridine-5'-phosphate glycosidase [Bacillota bacterium]|jgi:pseudouridine-5'-phosphate glycosidase|nr:pseudouridine-5'-phosphate glycosidase [Bacillota bacterium]MDI9415661.1 pseudouridine-5'-phosphate glycosidase [Bacillota bacterium]NLD12790.1 pseudouridine-5'-phosphate glycosidase [Bacillota bacterium]HAV21373.1 pseudouridine-5-phosphate glycosidase [Bacillota bacterium]HCD41876.1 pseudouridine-5-phosphate glycosidase [Bacillota bacterium]
MNEYLIVSDEVRDAIEKDLPVVAFETSILTHGLPQPHNVDLAKEVEAIARSMGVVPATTAVICGKLRVGLTEEEIELLGRGQGIAKAGYRDLGVLLATGGSGGTTVAASIALAEMAGIPVFVTGGIGGVHRGATSTFDVSNDLFMISRTDVATVCAGMKSILDLGLTMEVLETLGIPVIGYNTKVLPGFHVRQTPYKLLYEVKEPEDIAKIMMSKWKAGIRGGILVTVPVPPEDEVDPAFLEDAISKAVHEANEKGILGKDVTPYILHRLGELTGGATLTANLSLVRNNTRVGCEIARSYSSLLRA